MKTVCLLVSALLACLFASAACAAPKTEVVVLGTMHQMHAEMPYYSFAELKRRIEALDPDVLCVEVQPSDLETRPEEKNKREYPEVVYPLIDAKDYRVYAMEPAEPLFSTLLQPYIAANKAFAEASPEKANALDAYISATYALLKEHWNSPATVNDAFTDRLFEAKHAAQMAFVGSGEAESWQRWNEHFLSVIRRAIMENPGKRILVIVGAEHGYWLRQALREEPNVVLKPIE